MLTKAGSYCGILYWDSGGLLDVDRTIVTLMYIKSVMFVHPQDLVVCWVPWS